MRPSVPSAGAKLLFMTLLSAAGVVAATTAATVFAAGDAQRRAAARVDSSSATTLAAARHWESIRAFADSLSRDVGRPAPMDIARLSVARQWTQRNEAAADSALVHDDTPTALARARENIAVANQLAWQANAAEAELGRTLLLDGAKLLARTALQADDPSLHSAALRLQARASAMRAVPLGLTSAPGGDAQEARLRSIVRDRSMHPAARVVAIERMVTLSCLSTHDVLLGPSASRHATIDAMVNDARDVPEVVALRSALHRTLDQLDRSPEMFKREGIATSAAASATGTSLTESVLRLVVPHRVFARIDACRAAGI